MTRAAPPAQRPGPGPLPHLVVRRLDLRVRRRIEGLLPGDVRSTILGRGTELTQIRPYVPGDDVRAIDWNVTARTSEPHVRVHVAERAMTTWVVLDTSASMTFGTQERTKADVADGVVLALSAVSTSGANRLAVVTTDHDGRVALPPSGDRRRVLRIVGSSEPGSAGDMGRAIDLTDRVSRRAGAVVVVSDFRGSLTWARPLLRLVQRHHVLAVEVADPRETDLTDVGIVVVSDPETGRQIRVDTSDDGLRRRFAAAAAAERDEVRRTIRGTGAAHVVLSTRGDWLRPLAAGLTRRGVAA